MSTHISNAIGLRDIYIAMFANIAFFFGPHVCKAESTRVKSKFTSKSKVIHTVCQE